MERRTILSGGATALTISLTGCSGVLPETGPEYEEDDDIPPFPTDALEGDGWESVERDGVGQQYGRYDGDTAEEGVFAESGVNESVDAANKNLDEIFQGVEKKEFDLADEAYWGDDTQWGYAGFRQSNAWAVVGSTERNGLTFAPDTRTAIDLAERWFKQW